LAIVVLDTDAASKLFERRLPAPMLEHLVGQTLMITFVTIAEAVYGSRSRQWGARRTTALEQYYQQTFAVLPTRSQHLIPVARTCGALRADAEQRGITVPSNDAWVAETDRQASTSSPSSDQRVWKVPGRSRRR
jgi:predicted nucleic acid-binding protein